MSDQMAPLPLTKLFTICFQELKSQQTIFGIHQDSFYYPQKFPYLHFIRYEQKLESPLGVAAGPQTQLAQNIIASWLTGARYIELKTVQILDELEVSKPCIDMEDEGYNCEWSQELRLPQSFQEYLNAWIMIHILKHELKIGDTTQIGTIFNMSVGYNLEGILSPKVQKFFAQMNNCETELTKALDELRPLYPKIDELHIPTQITNNITLSTMHGCPPEEIEKIGMYLITEKKLHTTIKLNPTLNGPGDLRYLLNEHLGFTNIHVPDLAFEHDLKYSDGIKLIKNLQNAAKQSGVEFSIKLTNTLETENNKDNFASSNEMMYMSGRPLHLLAINLAEKIQQEFQGELDITFSAGIDAFNCAGTLSTGIKPLTVCTDLLKPGGYERFAQYFSELATAFQKTKATNLEEFVLKQSKQHQLNKARLDNLTNYKQSVLDNPRYHKKAFPWKSIKTERKLKAFDCIAAPCSGTCPTHQDIPTYMFLTEMGEYKKGLEVIRYSNPFPYTTGLACDHICEDKCTRMNYDETLKIRDIKRFLAFQEQEIAPVQPKGKRQERVAIIGGGPSGLSCAYFLALEGIQVEIFEAQDIVGGMCSLTLPDFRTGNKGVARDIERIKALGVTIHEKHPITTKEQLTELQKNFDFIYVAIGAHQAKKLSLPGEEAQGVQDFLTFLSSIKRGQQQTLPPKVLVIGGGNSAIDTVRTAKRLLPENGEVILVYRRTTHDMPAAREEIEELFTESIKILELTAPLEIITEADQVIALKCQRMELIRSKENPRGQLKPIIGSEFELPANLIISAIGQEISAPFLELFEQNNNGTVRTNQHKTNLSKIFVGGDLEHGPKSIIQAIADGKEVAWSIAHQVGIELEQYKKPLKGLTRAELKARKRQRERSLELPALTADKRNNFDLVVQTFSEKEAKQEASRCLLCDEICDVCVSVCPNRANIGYEQAAQSFALSNFTINQGKLTESDSFFFNVKQEFQTLNIGDFCNECGNCATFCPTAGRPYVDKPKIYLSLQTFEQESHNAYYFNGKKLKAKVDKHALTIKEQDDFYTVVTEQATIKLDGNTLELVAVEQIHNDGTIDMQEVAQAIVLYQFFKRYPYYQGK